MLLLSRLVPIVLRHLDAYTEIAEGDTQDAISALARRATFSCGTAIAAQLPEGNPKGSALMRARACAAILVACVIHSGDGGSDIMDEVVLAGVQFDPRADRGFAARGFMQRAVWVDDASHLAAGPAGICIENFETRADCARSVAEIDGSDPCGRSSRRIAF